VISTLGIQRTNIQIERASLNYQHHVLFQNLSVEFSAGKFSCILGVSGVGKTSLLRLIAGLESWGALAEKLHSGGESLAGKVSYLTQQPALLPWLNVVDNVMLSQCFVRGDCDIRHAERANYLLNSVGLSDAVNLFPAECSGGMRSRVMLARVLFEDKPIVLLDEPFAALDVITKLKMQDLLVTCLQGKTVVMVTHDPLEALRLADDIFLMSGAPAKIWKPFDLKSKSPREMSDYVLVQQAKLIELLQAAV